MCAAWQPKQWYASMNSPDNRVCAFAVAFATFIDEYDCFPHLEVRCTLERTTAPVTGSACVTGLTATRRSGRPPGGPAPG